MAVADHSRQTQPALAGTGLIVDRAGVLGDVTHEHGSDSPDNAAVPGSGDFGHFDDSSSEFIEPALDEIGLDERVEREAAALIGGANLECGRKCCRGHDRTCPGENVALFSF